MRVAASPILKSSEADSSSDAENLNNPPRQMERDFLRSWISIVAAAEEGSTRPPGLLTDHTHTQCDGSLHSRVRRNTKGASTGAEGEGYRTFLARMLLGLLSNRTSSTPRLQPSLAKATIATMYLTQPGGGSSHFQARSLLTGQVAGDATIKIGTSTDSYNNDYILLPYPTNSNNNRPTEKNTLSRQSTAQRRLMQTATKNRLEKKKGKCIKLESLGVFDFPIVTRNHVLAKRTTNLKTSKGASPVVKSLGTFDFDVRSKTMHAISGTNSDNNNHQTGVQRCNVVVKTLQSNFTIERDYWQDVVATLSSRYDEDHAKTREARMELGNTYFRWGDYTPALAMFQSILDRIDKRQHCLLAACVMEKIGCALAYQDGPPSDQKKSEAYVKEALLLRYHCHGPLHVDTVQTMNILASIYFRWEALEDSRDSFEEVLLLRQAMFGSNHPSVAVTAQALGKVHAKLLEVDKARAYFRRALAIYEELHLSKANPSVLSLQQDLETLAAH